MLTLLMEGFCALLVNPFGPLHNQLILPVAVVLASRFKVVPLHTGPLLVATGVAGGLGSTRVNGPTWLEGHPASATLMLSYNPDVSPVIITTPLALAVMVAVVGVPLFV
jgi:hypothetical protein